GVTTPRRTVHGTIAWELYDRGVGTWLQVSRESDSRVLVLLEGPVDATALAIPALPSTVDEDELFGTDALVVSVGVFRPDSTGTYTRQFATTEPLAIAR
ncbi:MAG: hypothetical protein JXB32_02770, partial [Deltaproteobacteria bacterium]|nr:hypothetical protein [Deltaproteobacteria bacterium]